MIPANESALYDLMQARFGIGDYDDADPKVPWWRARGTEIAKLKAQMRRRRLTIADLTTAVEYASGRGLPITGVWQLCDLVGIAKKAARETPNESDPDVRGLLSAAAAEAYERGDEGWAARLYACDLNSAARVLGQWDEHKGRAR